MGSAASTTACHSITQPLYDSLEHLDLEEGDTLLLRAVVEPVERRGGAEHRRVYALEQTIDAHRRMASNEATGKLVVLPHAATA